MMLKLWKKKFQRVLAVALSIMFILDYLPFNSFLTVYASDGIQQVNIAINKTTTSSSQESSGRDPGKAVDGDDSTLWVAANGNANNWWEVDLGQNYDITGSQIMFEGSGVLWKYKIEVSLDNNNWTLAVDNTKNVDSAQTQTQNFALNGRYVKVTVTETPGSLWTAFREVRVFGTPSTIPTLPSTPTGLTATSSSQTQINIAWNISTEATSYDLEVDGIVMSNITSVYNNTGLAAGSSHTYRVLAKNSVGSSAWSPLVSSKTQESVSGTLIPASQMTATAISQESGGRNAKMAADGDDTTLWVAANGNANNWWEVDLGKNYDITGSQIMFEGSGNLWKYKIEVSLDNDNWILAVDNTKNVDSAQTQTQGFTQKGRYVKVTVTETPGYLWTAFKEVRVYGAPSTITTIPSTPTGLTATASSQTQINIVWNSSTEATGYELEVDGTIITNTSSTYNNTGLVAGSSHSYRVLAKNSVGSSDWSPLVSAKTQESVSGTLISVSQMTATAISHESSDRAPGKASDGNNSTMWVAANGDANNWWEVDLGQSYNITGSEIMFEDANDAWKYKVEASEDNTNWTLVVDETANLVNEQTQIHSYKVTGRYLKVTITQTPDLRWTAISEFKVYADQVSPPPPPPPISSKSLMVLVPHEDDEAIIAAGVIEKAVRDGIKVKVVIATNGDYQAADYQKGQMRLTETINAMNYLGVPTSDIIALGYSDTGGFDEGGSAYTDGFLYRLYNATSDTQIFETTTGSKTYGIEGTLDDYHYKLTGTHGDYNRATFFSDLKSVINTCRPNDIYVTSIYDMHSDHAYLNLFAVDAIRSIKQTDSSYSPVMHEAIVHSAAKDSTWPIVDLDPTEIQPLSKPENLDSETLLDWNSRESVEVPADMLTLPRDGNKKYQVLKKYESQFYDYIGAFVKSDEVFWKKDFSNLAYNATITASSENTQAGQGSEKVADGVSEGYPRFLTKEWVTTAETSGAWIQLNWNLQQSISKVVLFDRPNLEDNITSATLTFSDGSSVDVGALPNDGRPLIVTIPSRNVTWVKMTINTATGLNTGLSEFEVYK